MLTPYCLLTTENGADGGEGHFLARPSTSCVVRRREGELRPPRPTPRFPFPPSVPPFMHRRSDRRRSFAQPARAPPPAWPPCAGCTHRLSRACSGTCGAVLPMAGRETETARPVCSGVDEAGQGRVGNARSGNEPCRTGRRAAANTRRCPPLPAARSAGREPAQWFLTQHRLIIRKPSEVYDRCRHVAAAMAIENAGVPVRKLAQQLFQ